MKYKLYENNRMNLIKHGEILEQFLLNRGIEDPYEYICASSDKHLHDPRLLDGIEIAVQILKDSVDDKESQIGIIVDADVDGFTSSSILYDYIVNVLKFDKDRLHIIMHEEKKHGLSNDVTIPESITLLIIPDAGSNDANECRKLHQKGVEIIVLDHHEIERENKYATVINPNNCDYPNKSLSGTGVVYKFLKEMDNLLWEDEAESYIELVGLSIISDSMDMKNFENKVLVSRAIEKMQTQPENINKFLLALLEKTSYSMGGVIDIIGIMFYVVPLINAVVRVGDMEDKLRMFQAFANIDMFFPYKKRGTKVEIQEDIYTHVARIATNRKAKQNREIDKSLELLIPEIEEKEWDKNKIMFVDAENVDKNYTGLVAMKIASMYNKPCLLIRKSYGTQYSGSGRNVDCDLGDLKGFLADTNLFKWIQGHPSAFGVSIERDNIRKAIEKINQQLENFDFSKTHYVDFVLNADELEVVLVLDMAMTKPYYAHGIDEMKVVVNDIEIEPEDVDVIGKTGNVIKFGVNGVEFIKFNCSEEEVNFFTNGLSCVKINVLGKPSVNEFNGNKTPQVIIEEYEVTNEE